MSERRNWDWLSSRLDTLKREGILNGEACERLEDYIAGKMATKPRKPLLPILLGTLSALLIGLGIILIMAFNWDKIGKAGKTVIAFVALLVGQSWGAFILSRRDGHLRQFSEAAALFWAIIFGAMVFLIGQIYQLPPNERFFLGVWCISTLCITYLLESLAATIVYCVLVVVFTAVEQGMKGVGIFFFPMLATLIPRYLLESANKVVPARKTTYHYFFIVTVAAGLGISLEKVVPGLWIVAYAGLFSCLYLFGVLKEPVGVSVAWTPSRLAGVVGTAIMAYIFSWNWPWEEIGWQHLNSGDRFHEFAAIYDYVITAGLFAAMIWLTWLTVRKKSKIDWVLASFTPFIVVLYLFVAYVNKNIVTAMIAGWAVNLWILIWCILNLVNSFKKESLLRMNAAMVYLTVVIVTRFFDSDTSFLARGIAFILCGTAIGVANLILLRIQRRKEIDHA